MSASGSFSLLRVFWETCRYLELLEELVSFYEPIFGTFWIVFPLYFCHLAKPLPLAPSRPRSSILCVGFTLVATVPYKSS